MIFIKKKHKRWLVGVWDGKSPVPSFSDSMLMGSHQELRPILQIEVLPKKSGWTKERSQVVIAGRVFLFWCALSLIVCKVT